MDFSLSIKILGLVQGVGFRYQAKKKADELGLVGWVRNNSDGSVECLVKGSELDLKNFLTWCYNGSKLSRVDKVDYNWHKTLKKFDSFNIF